VSQWTIKWEKTALHKSKIQANTGNQTKQHARAMSPWPLQGLRTPVMGYIIFASTGYAVCQSQTTGSTTHNSLSETDWGERETRHQIKM